MWIRRRKSPSMLQHLCSHQFSILWVGKGQGTGIPPTPPTLPAPPNLQPPKGHPGGAAECIFPWRQAILKRIR